MTTFPSAVLGIKVEILLNGTWTDITGYTYSRNPVVITAGRQDEAATLNPSQATVTLNNRDGRFSPSNTSGAYYPFLVRNTELRISVTSTSSASVTYSGYRFWGEVSSWPPQSDPSATDIYVDVTASGIWRRTQQGAASTVGSPVYRYYSTLPSASQPVDWWPCEDGGNATSFASGLSGGGAMTWTGTPGLGADSTSFTGANALAQLNGSAWTGAPGSSGLVASPATYGTAGADSWLCPGDVTSLTSAEVWGSGSGGGTAAGVNLGGTGGGGGEYAKITSVAVTPGSVYSFTVPAGGAPGANGSATSFSGDAATVTAHGATGSTGGTGSAAAAHHNGGNGAGNGGFGPGGGGAGSGGSGAAGNNGSAPAGNNSPGVGGSAVTGGGPGGSGGGASAPSGNAPASGPGGGGGGEAGTSAGPGAGGSGYAGQVRLTYTSSLLPAANVLRFLLSVPSTGGTNGAVLARVATGGTVATLDVTYGTGGTLKITGKNGGGGTLFTHTSGNIANGVPMMVSCELTTSGANVAWAFKYIKPGDVSATSISSGTVTTATVGLLSGNLLVNVSGTETTAVTVGHVTVQYALNSLDAMGVVINGHNGEYAADRFTRLCTESGIDYTLLSAPASNSAQMGPQADDTLGNLFQSVEDADRGLLFEPRDKLGLGYRIRLDMQNQSPAVALDYASFHLSPPLTPAADDQLIRNDVTVTRNNGSSARYAVTSGVMSTQSPPSGVGDYSYTPTVFAYADSQLANMALWIATVGTATDYRFPQVNVELARSAVASLFAGVPAVGPGDYIQITTPPAWLTAGTVKQLAYGFSETLSQYQWAFQFNTVPEAPWEGGGLPSW